MAPHTDRVMPDRSDLDTRPRTPGQPTTVVVEGQVLAAAPRGALRHLLGVLGWRGSLDDWLDMVHSVDGGADAGHLLSSCPQLFLIEVADIDTAPAALPLLVEAVTAVNRRWRRRTGRPLMAVVVG